MLLSDTVGFIRDLPHHLVASFKATLEEARQAELLLHVVDASNPQAEEQIQAVNAVLDGARLRQEADAAGAEQDRPRARPVVSCTCCRSTTRARWRSAPRRGQGLDELRDAVIEVLGADFADAEIDVDAGNGRVLAYLTAHAEIYRQEFHDNRVIIRCHLPRHLLHHIQGPDVSVVHRSRAGKIGAYGAYKSYRSHRSYSNSRPPLAGDAQMRPSSGSGRSCGNRPRSGSSKRRKPSAPRCP